MSRKAVQGYSEKSFYDYTSFLGLLATSDPLNEGYFKHLVNFDISDTGQSVTPREGYLTTTLRYVSGEVITFSDKTIIYKDLTISEFIIIDFATFKAYTADISKYNVEDNFITVTQRIDYMDLTDTYNFLYNNVPYMKTQIDDIEYLEKGSYVEFKQTLNLYTTGKLATDTSYWKYTNVITDGISNLELVLLPAHPESIDLSFSSSHDSMFADDFVTNPESVLALMFRSAEYAAYKSTLKISNRAFLEHINLGNTREARTIVDSNMIRKCLVPVTLDYISTTTKVSYPFILEIYYRDEPVTIKGIDYPGNTLNYSVVDTSVHDTLNPVNRNIASYLPIIPDTLQTQYGIDNRPVGHFDTVGLIYTTDLDRNKYFLNNIYKNTNYRFTPYFSIGPAYIPLEESAETECKWAYKFDVTNSTKHGPTYMPEDDEILYSSSWLTFDENKIPEYLFSTRDTSYNSTTWDFNNADISKRHYKGIEYVCYIVPTAPNITNYDVGGVPCVDSNSNATSDDVVGVALSTLADAKAHNMNPDYSAITTLYTSLVASLNTMSHETDVENIYAGLQSINELGFRFVFYPLSRTREFNSDDTSSGFYYHNVWGSNTASKDPLSVSYSDKIEPTHSEGAVYTSLGGSCLLTASELVAELKVYAVLEDSKSLGLALIPLMGHCSKLTDTNGAYQTIVHSYTDHTYFTSNTVSKLMYFMYNNVPSNYCGVPAELFYTQEDDKYIASTTVNKLLRIKSIKENTYFRHSIIIRFYLKPYAVSELEPLVSAKDYELKDALWTAGATVSSSVLSYGYDSTDVTTIDNYDTINPPLIQNADNFLVYDNSYLVKWTQNILFISEQSDYYKFRDDSKITFGEKIVKVIGYKTIMMVFTVQHLYAVYLTELVTGEGDDAVSTFVWSSNIVLYNIRTSEKYADVIQIFNDMVLFYSEDGQLFMIKPATMIDSETRFSLKYFNKSANDVLVNYDTYINERLATYGYSETVTKDDVQVKALLSINYIKIFYFVPGLITYILVYDVINNRYTIKDSVSFSNIDHLCFIEGSEMYQTVYNNLTTFTFPYSKFNDSEGTCDKTFATNFRRYPIHCLLDTGDMNLNNHIRKRFRDLYVTFKNTNAKEILFDVETELDNIVSHPFHNNQIEVQEINGEVYFIPTKVVSENDLLNFMGAGDLTDKEFDASHSIFMSLDESSASKLVTYKTSILGLGKVMRLKMQFISKGQYKIQCFGIVYKERRV